MFSPLLGVILGVAGFAALVGATMWIFHVHHRDNPHLWTPPDHHDQENDQ